MRMSRDATAQSKRRIVEVASTMARERGWEATAIADVMSAAGMTHGGFYKHFASKDDLAAAAVRRAFADVVERFDRRASRDGGPAAIAAYRRDYLSPSHVDDPGRGCPIAALGPDAFRHADALASEFAAGAEALIARCAGDSTAAIRDLVMLVGAVVVARAVGPGALREKILAACAAPGSPGRTSE